MVESAAPVVDSRKGKLRLCQLGRRLEGPLRRRFGSVQIVQLLQRIRQIGQKPRILRMLLQASAKNRRRRRVAILLDQQNTQVGQRVGVSGMARQDDLEGFFGLGEAAQRHQRRAAAEESVLEVGAPGQRRLEGLERLLGARETHQRFAQIVVVARVLGVDGDGSA